MPRRIITEEELREAARELLEYELAIFDSYNDYPDHIFHGKFRLNMAALIHEVKRGAVEAAKYSMGFTFYAKRCIAAALLIFTLSCITMPEAVLAGYHKLIEVIETVFEEYTEYRFKVYMDNNGFNKVKFNYLPKNFVETNKIEHDGSFEITFEDGSGNYFDVYQKMVIKNNKEVYIFDAEDTKSESIEINGNQVKLIFEDEKIRFIYMFNHYRISGTTNLSKDILVKIITHLEI